MIDSELLAFTALAALLTVSPGADTMLLFRNVLRGGRGAGVATAFGGRCGLVVHGLLSALGLSAVVAHSALAYDVLKVMGAGYLIWLGVRTVLKAGSGLEADLEVVPGAAPDADLEVDTGSGGQSAARPRKGKPFLEGFLTNVLNPKTAVFYLAILPQFVRPGDPVLSRSLLLCTIHVAMSLGWYLFLCLVFSRARRLLGRPRVRRALDFGSGVALAGLGLRLGLGGR